MKVLKDNYTKPNIQDEFNTTDALYPRIYICDKCNSELQYEEHDVKVGAFGCATLLCPLCGEENVLDGNEKETNLTIDNIEFPTHFYHVSKETGAVDICTNEEIRRIIKEAILWFRKNKDEYYWNYECGNIHVDVCRYEGDELYDITVTNNYYNTYIPFKHEDY